MRHHLSCVPVVRSNTLRQIQVAVMFKMSKVFSEDLCIKAHLLVHHH